MSYLLSGSDSIRVYTRAEWNARTPRAMDEQPRAPWEAFLHHSDDSNASTLDHLAEQKAKMRQTQDFHMDVRGWSDLAYHFVVFQPYGSLRHARVFEGRDWHKVPAAQLNHNTGTLAVCVVGNLEHDALKRNTRYAIGLLLKSHPAARALGTVGGHRDVVATSCPGQRGYEALDRIASASGLRRFRP